MVGLLIELLLSWIIIYLHEKKHLSVLGFKPTLTRVRDFSITFIISVLFCALGFLLKIYFGNQVWIINPQLSTFLFLEGLWWNVKSIMFEELIFRGVLLYILIVRIGFRKAILISAAAFGIYHWFSYGIFGNIAPMIIVFFITGVMGLLLAYSYCRTSSLFVPLAIHLGWNFTQNFIFSDGPLGNGIFIQQDKQPFRTDSYFGFALVTVLPMLGVLLVNYFYISWRYQAKNIVKTNSDSFYGQDG